jgi:hypothetical protein
MRTLVCLAVALAALVVGPPPSPALSATEPKPRDEANLAIDRALEFLARNQNDNGSWSGAGASRSPAVTALCVMAFLSAGHVPGEGPYGETVVKGIKQVLSMQQANGLFAISGTGHQEMYHHGICTLMAAEACGMCKGELADELRARLAKAVSLILKAQRTSGERGGWRYTIEGSDADLSVTGWQLLALRAAKNVGCDVPAERIEAAVDYVRKCYTGSTGAFRYQPSSRVTVPCTGTGVLCLELCGKNLHRCPESLRAGSFIVEAHRRGVYDYQYFYYGIYYCSQATFQLGDNYWESFRPLLLRLLVPSQNPNGSWTGRGAEGFSIGPNYCTALSVLALTVEYRFLPIYQRGEEPMEKP